MKNHCFEIFNLEIKKSDFGFTKAFQFSETLVKILGIQRYLTNDFQISKSLINYSGFFGAYL